jgi:hypothetical protein
VTTVDVIDDDEDQAQPPPRRSWAGNHEKWTPQFRRKRPSVAPPRVSAEYRADPGYVRHVDLHHDVFTQANHNHRQWHEAHSAATNQTQEWLASEGLLGETARTAYTAWKADSQVAASAAADLEAARAALGTARWDLADGVTAARSASKPLPSGAAVVAAETAVRACELVVEEVQRSGPGLLQQWGQQLQAADWAGALAGCEQMKGDQAEAAVVWLRAKVDPGPGPLEDPLGWVR